MPDHAQEILVPGEYVMIAVSDNGCGMTRDVMDNVFEPFFTTKGAGQGTGLGLSTVYGIVKQNEGFIRVYSEPEKGTTLKLYFPKDLSDTEYVKPISRVSAEITRGNETVLLVEDEPALLKMSEKILERLGYAVFSATDAQKAIAIARENAGAISLLMTDVVMPGMSGKELANTLLDQYPGMKCLFMSGYTADVIAEHGILDDGIQFINKPFSIEEVAGKIREIMNS